MEGRVHFKMAAASSSKTSAAGWHSLSGYLYYKIGGGPLSKLKVRRRLWYVLDESACRLLVYKTRDAARSSATGLHRGEPPPPMEHITLQNAGITLTTGGDANQFTVLSEGKEHQFTAENHESMMIWLMGLQGKRDAFARRNAAAAATACGGGTGARRKVLAEQDGSMMDYLDEPSQSEGSTTPTMLEPRRPQPPPLTHAYSVASTGGTAVDQLLRQERLQRLQCILGDSMDVGGMDFYKEPDAFSLHSELRQRSWEMPERLLRRQNAATTLDDTVSWAECAAASGATTAAITATTMSAAVGADDVFIAEDCGGRAGGSGGRFLKKTESDASNISKERSGSNDSILDRDSDYSSGISTHLVAELEQQIITTKCELAVMMNKEACFKTLLEHRDALILELDTKCKELERARGDKKSLDRRMKEDIRQLQNQNRFLNEEVKNLAKLQHMQQDRALIQQQHLTAADVDIERWKRDYLYILQSTINVPSGDVVEGLEVNLFGGNVHKERIKELLDEARTINPGLPTYERQAGCTVLTGVEHFFPVIGRLFLQLCRMDIPPAKTN